MNTIIPTEDTIAAIASAISIGQGGVAIVRVSGIDAIHSCQSIVKTNSIYAWESNRVFHGYIVDTEDKSLIDEILILTMKAPNSFTGEDIVELHCHGGIIIVNRVLEILLKNQKVRLANPGEFSQRAFLNGKISLTQAEAINELISAKNVRAAELAFNGVKGDIQKKIIAIKDQLIDQLSEIEARVDFDEDFEDFDYKKFDENIQKIKKNINFLIDNAKSNEYINDGISIALIGKTNTGKSSLLNLLSKQNKAIVTEIPGTTRDIIEVNIVIKNIPVRIIDTAGIRKTQNLIENIGIKKSLEMIKQADYVIYLYDLEKGLDSEDKLTIAKIPKQKLITILGNKKDLIQNDHKQNQIPDKNILEISVKESLGEDALLKKIIEKCGRDDSENIDIFLNRRQITNLQDCLRNLNDTDEIIKNKLPFDLLSIEIREAIKNLSKLTGQELTEVLMNNIFSKFCIGK
tara:strand:+ start:2792 stop:4174 length:1383 start_codon:yes stop_codon:yes gene_type:complete